MMEFTQNVTEMKLLKARLQDEQRQKETIKKIKTDLNCSWCNTQIDDNCYYKCEEHGSIFCKNCATNNGKRELLHKDAVKCKTKKLTECIWRKIILDDF